MTQWGISGKYPWRHKRHPHYFCKQPIPGKKPNVYQHEISIVTEGTDEAFPLIAITNLDFAKTLHIEKGEIIGFARPEVKEVVFIATTNELNVEPYMDTSPRNWIPPRKRVPLEPKDDSKKVSCFSTKEHRLNDLSKESIKTKVKMKELQGIEERIDRYQDESQESMLTTFTIPRNEIQQGKYIETKGQSVSFRQIDELKLSTGLKLDKKVNQSHCDESKATWTLMKS